ncbi:MAG: DUF4437 domain-containing protein [Sinobacteraceae bacterium]|nr:DUF4437 domain-containing protein [Nevskiaceae bacterium]
MRPHIEFIPSQWLPWDDTILAEARAGTAARVLSRDDLDGACSLIVRYPAGYRRGPETLDADEEFIVLEGGFEIDGVAYGRHDYAHLPRGLRRTGLHCAAGAQVLTFFSKAPIAYPGDGGNLAAADPARLVRHIDTRAMEGMKGPRKHMASEGFNHGGTVHKLLFDDPLTQDKTWIAGLPPYWNCDTVERHPVCEEEFALAGDIHMPNGVMYEGAYFWRPADVAHGPFGTVGGTLHLCRGKGGRYATRFEPAGRPFRWDPPYEPILPADYRRHLRPSTEGSRP